MYVQISHYLIYTQYKPVLLEEDTVTDDDGGWDSWKQKTKEHIQIRNHTSTSLHSQRDAW